MLKIFEALNKIGETVDGFHYFINENGNFNCKSVETGMTFFASETTNQWVTI